MSSSCGKALGTCALPSKRGTNLSNIEAILLCGFPPERPTAKVAAHVHLEQFKRSVEGKPRLGVEIYGMALLVVPKTLLENSGMDVQDR